MLHYFRDFKRLTFKQIVVVWVLLFVFLVGGGMVLDAFRPDHLLFIFTLGIMGSLLLGKSRSRQFLKDWTPWFAFWLAYDMLRGVADQVRQINIQNVYDFEHALFGWAFPSSAFSQDVWDRVFVKSHQWVGYLQEHMVPPLWFQGFKIAHEGAWYVATLDAITGTFYSIHFFIPWILAALFWGVRGDRKMFFRYTYAIAILNALALITFVMFPAAPPWYVLGYGFHQPGNEFLVQGAAGGMVKLDRLLGIEFFAKVWTNMNPNRFAAVPSLHGGHSLIVAIFATIGLKHWGKKRYLFWIYPAGMWFSAFYLNHHYIIDPLLATIYIGIGILITEKLVYPHWIRKYLLDREELSPEEQAELPPLPEPPDHDEAAPPTPEGA